MFCFFLFKTILMCFYSVSTYYNDNVRRELGSGRQVCVFFFLFKTTLTQCNYLLHDDDNHNLRGELKWDSRRVLGTCWLKKDYTTVFLQCIYLLQRQRQRPTRVEIREAGVRVFFSFSFKTKLTFFTVYLLIVRRQQQQQQLMRRVEIWEVHVFYLFLRLY